MTDQNSSERTRRTFMKGAAATGVAATGITAFSGNAAAQGISNIDTSRLNVNQRAGRVGGLVVVNVQNVALQDVLDATVNIVAGDDIVDIDIRNINILNDNTIQIAVADAVDVAVQNLQVILTVLGTTEAGQQAEEFNLEETTSINQ